MPIITPEDFREGIVRGMAASGCRIEDHALSIDCGPRTAKVLYGGTTRFETRQGEMHFSNRDEGALAAILKNMRAWWKNRQWDEALLAAHGFVCGSDDGIYRPYMVETAIIRLFEQRGMDMLGFRNAMRAHIGNISGNHSIRSWMEQVWTSFPEYDRPPEFEEWCWRSNTRHMPAAIAALGDMQFRMAGKMGWGIMPYVELAPGVMWIGGPDTSIWIKRELVPESLMQAAKGRPLTDVVGHAAFDVPGLKVLSMQHVHNKRSGTHRTVVKINAVKEDATDLVARMEEERRPAKAA